MFQSQFGRNPDPPGPARAQTTPRGAFTSSLKNHEEGGRRRRPNDGEIPSLRELSITVELQFVFFYFPYKDRFLLISEHLKILREAFLEPVALFLFFFFLGVYGIFP